jgi:hypothetical protein
MLRAAGPLSKDPRGLEVEAKASQWFSLALTVATKQVAPEVFPMGLSLPKRVNIIFLRYSDPKKQTEDSSEAQEKRVRHLFEQHDLDHRDAMVMSEKGIRGDLESGDREVYGRLLAMIKAGEVGVLGVDQQGRFSRGLNVGSIVQDLVYNGGRFLSGDGVDTNRKGWEDLLGLKSIHNRMELRDLGHRVRRQQEHLAGDPDGCIGDYPYGYISEFHDPIAGLAWKGHGPKPRRRTVIDRKTAAVVGLVFYLYAKRGWAKTRIVRHLNQLGSRVPPIVSKKWTCWEETHITRMLENEKYIGIWEFGGTTTIRDSVGRKKQVPATSDQRIVKTHRPHLAIIDQETWEITVAKLAMTKERYGFKDGQRKRGLRVPYNDLFPPTLLSGMIYCDTCGNRIYRIGDRKKQPTMGCSRHKRGLCTMSLTFFRNEAEEKVVALVGQVLAATPEWLAVAVARMRETISQARIDVPQSVTAKEERLQQIDHEIRHLLAFIRRGEASDAVASDLHRLEQDAKALRVEIDAMKNEVGATQTMPDDFWVQDQVRDLVGMLKTQLPNAALTLRKIVSKIIAEPVIMPGKTRGYIRLRVKFCGKSLVPDSFQTCPQLFVARHLRRLVALGLCHLLEFCLHTSAFALECRDREALLILVCLGFVRSGEDEFNLGGELRLAPAEFGIAGCSGHRKCRRMTLECLDRVVH